MGVLKDLRLIALGHYSNGNIFDSEIAAVEGLSLLDRYSKKDTVYDGRKALYNQLGVIYRETKKYEKALEIYDLSLTYSKKKSDSITLINNKANIYKDFGKYQKAADQLNVAYKKIGNDTSSLQFAMIIDNLGYVQSKLENTEALPNLKKALKIREASNYLPGLYSSYKNLALYYFDRNDKTQALNFANKAYEVANSLKSATYLQNALSLYAIMNDDPKFVQFKKITDSIAEEKQLAENKNAFIKYNVANEKKRTADALLEGEREKNQKLIFLILGIIILLSSIFIYFALRIRHKKEKILQVHKTEARISKKVHDEVANDVYQLMAKLQGKYKDDETIMDALETIYNKTRDISKENSAIEIEADFNEQLNDLLLSYQTETTAISTRNLAILDWKIVPTIKKETVYRVLQELMTNMKKHSGATAVLLNFKQQGKHISIAYSDNGKGCILKNKNGLQNAENRIQAIKGTIIFESEPGNGFRSKISI
ncbi:tetratricopeptide repeat-containing sensor histidine kinase [Aequorivita vladivostokensis]|uniref:tetratricopeptide repeat-containing sensor histidine kinase n=1 Tax=Aequorivita vladivostokensis TaxID=171194 RepID=UPI001F0A3479|nr:tetratricopeptide repeat-containing sensor histidine kinase [Aequorivita vladivostokensis]